MTKAAYILAGEPSGDQLAACLMRAQKPLIARWHGIGGPLMIDEGLEASQSYEALQIIGLGAALKSYARLKKLMSQLLDEASTLRPDVIFTIDAKAFSLRFAKALRKRMQDEGWSAPIIQMVAPTIWAYGAGRRHAFEDAFDAMLCLFPMERSLFDEEKLKLGFIGHPAAYEEVRARRQSGKLLLLPGSRNSEIETLLPVFLDAAKGLLHTHGLSVTIASVPHKVQTVRDITDYKGVKAEIISGTNALKEAMADHDVMIAASGTVTLEAALSALPGIAAYRLNPLLGQFMRARFYHPDPVLPNIILQQTLYPFYFQRDVTAANMQQAVSEILQNYDAATANSLQKSQILRSQLRTDANSFEAAITQALDDIALI